MRRRPSISSLFVISIAAAIVAPPVQAEESAARAPRIERSALPSGVSSGWWAEVLGSLSKAPSQGSPTDTTPSRADWTAQGNQAFASFGVSLASAGDVNGDGYDDAIAGAYLYDHGQLDEGRAFAYYGSAAGLSTTPDWRAESNQANAWFGASVGGAGDVNGDGYDDVIVGSILYSNGQAWEGRAFAYYGSASGLSATADWTAESDQDIAYFGISVGGAGDVNGDGYDDVIVGSWYHDNGQAEEGRAFAYHGSASGLSTTANWTAESNQASAVFGISVGGAGDVNGDGYDDAIVGASLYDHGQLDEGRAFAYYGSASGLSTTPNWTAESDQASAVFGGSVASAGDVNGDGYADVIVGAHGYDHRQDGEGRAFVYYGSASGLSTIANWTSESNQDGAGFGYSVAGAGDVNGDGYGEVIVGARSFDNGQTDEGRVFVFCGSMAGLRISPCRKAESNQASALFGSSVAGSGDVNGDSYDDVIVGAFFYDHGQTDEGIAVASYGRPD